MKDTSTEDTALSIGHSLPGECAAGGYCFDNDISGPTDSFCYESRVGD